MGNKRNQQMGKKWKHGPLDAKFTDDEGVQQSNCNNCWDMLPVVHNFFHCLSRDSIFLDAFDMADILFCKNLFLKSDLDHKNLIEEKDFLKFKR